MNNRKQKGLSFLLIISYIAWFVECVRIIEGHCMTLAKYICIIVYKYVYQNMKAPVPN